MKEPIFILRNQDKWKKIEAETINANASPEILASNYKSLTEDLSYAQTFYPSSDTTYYLNDLAVRYHKMIYVIKKEKKSRFKDFWLYEVPFEMAKNHRQIFWAFVVFLVSTIIGVFSAYHDQEFVRLILGDGYVNMTLENIANGKPMDVYASGGAFEMFYRITLNNIQVAFYAFVLGILTSLGTGFLLFRNGIMLGSFQYFFYEHGVLKESLLSIWTHGTLEITAIVFAGGAGFVLGNSLLFPKHKKRSQSLRDGAKSGLKIVIGLVPIFIIAGFLEGFVTRQVEWPLVLRLFFILSSLAFIIFYYFWYAFKVYQSKMKEN
ncbi:stage II sporulation protein M [Flammeovirga yaeyamensis]|uniref:Stage II sporulation protein M n=1 Tax=Flammeovirga yaeyamensis TaxID=367791 RepID=A0AAX1NCX1_9BACT|nr:stage II sporulation protein M [Flammeovirga yaeyamensis]MBB3699521.1 putative membrane protein SpoIIM required for sporulation [Flammeovirga yaeyamensis]NMF35223.1 stage II sporulation protein M [Flammeovirga yaeyamensis]QWG04085.1 stage II sporulation protein M [Flammeovirga yaeyamensis]